jgi:hypothetical protein
VHHLLNILNYFAELRANRHDDSRTVEWKSRQLPVWAGLLVLLIGFGLSAAAADFLDTMDGNATLRSMWAQWRSVVPYLVVGGLGLAFLSTVYSWWSVIRFAKTHEIE